MTQISLHRASRIEKAIVEALKANEPVLTTRVSIFSPSVEAVLDERQKALVRSVDMTKLLLRARADIRAVVGKKNAEVGISYILARQAEIEARVVLFQRMPGVSPEKKAEAEDPYGFMRRSKKQAPPSPVLDVGAAVALAAANKARFSEAAATVEADIEVGTVTAELSRAFQAELRVARRELDELSDLLRPLNANTLVEVDDDLISWLTQTGVL